MMLIKVRKRNINDLDDEEIKNSENDLEVDDSLSFQMILNQNLFLILI